MSKRKHVQSDEEERKISEDISGLEKKLPRYDLDEMMSKHEVEKSKSSSSSQINLPPLPQKKFYRQRAHVNPLCTNEFIPHPNSPEEMNWSEHYGQTAQGKSVEFVDVGCGYGGLLMSLATMFPDVCMVGMEIRTKVSQFVKDKIKALRARNPGMYDNVCCLRTNAMQFMLNYFKPAQLTKMFFLFPDPHFKKRKHKWRIISKELLDKYARVLRPGGLIYTITDVEELHEWMVKHLTEHSMFVRLSEEQMSEDQVVPLLFESTEEGQKVTRNSGKKFHSVFKRIYLEEFAESAKK